VSVTRAELPTIANIERAAKRLQHVAHRTPVVTSRTVDARTGATVFFKCENLQRGGAFKFRGAYNTMAGLPDTQAARGVVAFSSGNHAQAVALAGQLLGIPRVIVMPSDAPAVKRRATAEYGAEIVTYDRARDDREAIGRAIAEKRGATMVPPFNHPAIIAGTGTVARELLEDTGPLDVIVVPCGGGGLLAGTCLSAAAFAPQCRVIGVEPAAGDDGARSFRAGTLQRIDNPQTIADGARTPMLGDVPFEIIRELAEDIVTVDDPTLLRAMFFLWERLKLVVEPTGALPFAAILNGTIDVRGKRVGIVLSGGNVDLDDVSAWRKSLPANAT
jgi:threonine dehydratase